MFKLHSCYFLAKEIIIECKLEHMNGCCMQILLTSIRNIAKSALKNIYGLFNRFPENK